jgi:signal peptidase I
VFTVVPRAVDGAALTVLTGSMTPEIAVGSVVVVRPVDPGTLQVGDVVTYQKEPGRPGFVTHRIVEIHPDTTPVTLTTKGDANRGEDTDPVPVTAVRGKVMFSVPYLGTVKNAISTGGFGLLTLLIGLLGYAAFQVTSALRDRTRPPADVRRLPDTAGLELKTLVATLRTDRFAGLSPSWVAQLLRMDLLDVGDETFTVAHTRESSELTALLDLLTPFEPVQLTVSEPMRVPLCTTTAPANDEVDDVAA